VEGYSDQEIGVAGLSQFGQGVRGYSAAGKGVTAWGFSFGIYGESEYGVGVYGLSSYDSAVKGTAIGKNNLAGDFEGPVSIKGTLVVSGGGFIVFGPKSAAVPFPDGSQRLLYCMESPELWFEDFGSAKLRRGRATVKLNDFVNAIVTRDYRVFLSPEGDCSGLYVARKGAATFEVRELGGGKSSVAFSYRVVGRRKDIKAHKRFAKFEIPKVPTPPKMDRLPPKTRALSAAVRRSLASAEKEIRAMQQAERKGGRMPVAKRRRK
jgi:hypothetical protein